MNIDINALKELAQEKDINFEDLSATIEEALLAAYHKTEDAEKFARAVLNRKTGTVSIFAKPIINKTEKAVVEEHEDPFEYELGEEVDVTPQKFGFRALSIAKQIVLQILNAAEETHALGQLKNKKHEIISGIVKEADHERPGQPPRDAQKSNVYFEVGEGITATLPPHEQVPNENYSVGQRYRLLVIDIAHGQNGPKITVSRTHPDLVKKLFEIEVPELREETVEIMSLAREAGHRTKLAIKSNDPGVNAKGSLIGPMGQRARAVIDELSGEKVDIIEWDENPAKFIANSLSPAKATGVKIVNEASRTAQAIVPDYQLSLAIGKEGQNVRLAVRLTGWKIDVFSDGKTEAPEEK
ncbi:MAG: transcription termination factor NusA [Candidatus Ancillula sp.]|nr:transcription termination factor NusA [Candidatus Ancillula sp.]